MYNLQEAFAKQKLSQNYPSPQAGHSECLRMAVVLDVGQSSYKCESTHGHPLVRSFLVA